jgi:hypothetical protein
VSTPDDDADAIEIPTATKRRMGLDGDRSCSAINVRSLTA